MQQLADHQATPKKARVVASIAAALLGMAVLCQPGLADARGGGGHGGGFMAGSTVVASMAADFAVMSLL